MSFLLLLFLLCSSFAQREHYSERIFYKRRAGILLHISSLPGNYGIGTLGKAAYDFVDFLAKARQSLWEILPINPTGFGDSPYLPISSFGGNPYLIDLEILVQEKLLEQAEIDKINWGESNTQVDFGIVFKQKMNLLKKAFKRFIPNGEYENFKASSEQYLLQEHVLYMALKEYFEYKSWLEWPEEYKRLDPSSLRSILPRLSPLVEFHYFLQFKFAQQWQRLRRYANMNGVLLIGDLPAASALDSADVWMHRQVFQIGNGLEYVQGVPPDIFCEKGQVWGNPLYRWEEKEKVFDFWEKRIRFLTDKVDIIRLDHFVQIDHQYKIPVGKSAKEGFWEKGPGFDFIHMLHTKFPLYEFILEDLGHTTESLKTIVENSYYAGFKMLQFGFITKGSKEHRPYNYPKNSVCYLSNHDLPTAVEFASRLTQEERKFIEEYFDLSQGADLRLPLIKAGMASVSKYFITQIQDYLALGVEGRMNLPGEFSGNWRWRMKREDLTNELAKQIAKYTDLYCREP